LIFRGTFEHALDAKYRLTVPAKFRAGLAGRLVLAITPPTEESNARSLSIWPADAFDEFAELALKSLHPLSPRAEVLRNALYANSWDTELDSANRLMIPQPARDFVGLGKDVVITGAGNSLQVWDRGAYAAYNAGILARFPEIAASFDHTD
jgi:MraZ protein